MLDDPAAWLDDDPADVPDLDTFERCQWIEGEPSPDDGCKCGASTVPGHPYCGIHRQRAVLHVPERRVQAHFDRLAKEAWEALRRLSQAPEHHPATPSSSAQAERDGTSGVRA